MSSAVWRSEKSHPEGQTVTVVDVVGIVMSTKAAGSAGRTVTKVGVTVVAAVTVTTQGAVPLHPPPLQPVNTDPTAGVAVSVTVVL